MTFDFSSSGFDPVPLAQQLSRHTPVPIPYKAPPNYAFLATLVASLIALAVTARVLLPLLMSRWAWAVGTITTSLVMVGGFMFVRIRGMPYVASGPNGSQMIAGGFQSQYGIEVQIVAFICEGFSPTPPDRRVNAMPRWPALDDVLGLDRGHSSKCVTRSPTFQYLSLEYRFVPSLLSLTVAVPD